MERRAEPELMDLPDEAEAYARADFGAVNDAFVERLCALAPLNECLKVLDLGTGPGDIPLRVLTRRPYWTITAVDGAEAMLRLASKAIDAADTGHAIQLLLADAKHLPLADRSFDVVMSNSLLHHLSEPIPFWREIARVGNAGATLLVRDLMRPADASAARTIVDEYASSESPLLQEEFYRSLLSAYSLDEVTRQLRAAGLGHLRIEAASDRHLDIWGTLT